MIISEKPDGNTLRITITGSIMGVDSARKFELKTEEWLQSHYKVFDFDLENLIAMNSASIGRLILFNNHLNEKGCSLKMSSCSPNLMSTLRLVRADTLLNIDT